MEIERLLAQLLQEVRELRERADLPEAYPKKRAAHLLGVSVRTLDRMISDGKVQTCDLGMKEDAGIPRSEIQRLCTPKPASGAPPPPKGGRRAPKRRSERTAKEEAAAIRALTRSR